MQALKDRVIRLLEEAVGNLKTGNTELSDSEAMDLMSLLVHQRMSKATACEYLNLSRSRFDDLVRERKLPRGKKIKGFKELCWYRDELDECVNKIKR